MIAIKLGLGKGPPSSGSDSEDDAMSDEDMDSSAKEDAAQAILDAVQSKDKSALVDAFQTMVDLCGGYGSGDEGDSGDE